MRYVVLIAVFATAVVAGWFWLARDRSAETAAMTAQAERKKAELGLKNMLRSHAAFNFEGIVVGPKSGDGLVDFRAQLDQSGRRTPAYGQARGKCQTDAERTECWRIVYLEADGQEISISSGRPKADPQDAPTATVDGQQTDTATTAAAATSTDTATAGNVTTTGAQSAGATETGSQPATATGTTTTQPEATPATAPSYPPTHRVARAVINTRSGPGTSNPVITRLTAGAQLSLLDEQGGWGRFVVLGGENDGLEVWAAFSILEAL